MTVRKEVTFLTNLTPDIYASYESLTGESIGWREKEGWKFSNTVVLEIDSENVNYGITRTFSVKPVSNSVRIEWHGIGDEPAREFDPQYKRIGATFNARFEEESTPNISNQRFEQSFSTGSCTWGGGASEAAVLNSYTAKSSGVDQLLAKFYPSSTFTLYISFYCEEYSYTSEEYQTNFQTSIPITFSIASTTQISELSPSINIPSDVINEIVTVDHDTISNYAWYKAFEQFPGFENLPDGWPLVIRVPVKYPVGAKAKESWVETVGDSTLSSMYIGITYTGLESSPSAKIQSSNPFIQNESDDWSTTSFLFDSNTTEHQTSTNVYIYLFARDSRNQLGKTLIQSLNPEIYKTPTIESFTASRAISNTELSDEGTHPLLTASWTVWAPMGQTPYGSTKLDIKKNGVIIDTEYNVLDQASPTIFENIIIPIEEGRVFDLVVYDAFKSSASTSTYIDSVYCTMDFLAGGKGITFGGLALKEGFVNRMESSFEAPVSISHVDETDGSLDPMWIFDTATKSTKIHGTVEASKSDGSSAWKWDRASGNLHTMSNMYFKNPDMTKNGFIWDAVNYTAYLQTVMNVSNTGFIKASHAGYSWFNGTKYAPFQAITAHRGNTDSLWPSFSIKSTNGVWTIGTLGDILEIYYMPDTAVDGDNPRKRISFRPDWGSTQKVLANSIALDNVELWKVLYPVGAVYLSFSSTSPASLFGGTWTQITGRFLRMDNGTGTGGSDTHTHTPGSGWGNYFAISTDKYAYYRYSAGASWTSNYWGGPFSSVGGSGNKSQNSFLVSYGSVASSSNVPAYQNVYAWRRTA